MLPFDRGFTRFEGEDGTSCHPPFPGRPGLSQSCSRRVFHTAALRLFYQGTRRSWRAALQMGSVSYAQFLHRPNR